VAMPVVMRAEAAASEPADACIVRQAAVHAGRAE
jgi:hypothetical protein